MWQAIMTSPGVIEFREANIPKAAPGEVLIKIMRIGACGSDVHVYHGKHPFTTYPVVQGHEIAAQVVEVGAGVKKDLKPGDKVTVQPQVSCGQYYPCQHGDYHICDDLKVMGFQTTGMASEYFAVASDKVIKLPDDISYDDAALIEPLAVACHALRRGSVGVAGKKILVLGAGPIGNLVAQVAKANGTDKVMITDISEFRLNLAKDCGIDYVVNTKNMSVKKAIEQYFGADKADLILDCAGNQQTVYDAVDNARKGSEIIIVAVIPGEVKVNFGLVQDREIKLIGTLMYKKEDYLEAIGMLSSGKIHTSKIITGYYDFKDYIKAMNILKRPGTAR